jgi:hypothetical protein
MILWNSDVYSFLYTWYQVIFVLNCDKISINIKLHANFISVNE